MQTILPISTLVCQSQFVLSRDIMLREILSVWSIIKRIIKINRIIINSLLVSRTNAMFKNLRSKDRRFLSTRRVRFLDPCDPGPRFLHCFSREGFVTFIRPRHRRKSVAVERSRVKRRNPERKGGGRKDSQYYFRASGVYRFSLMGHVVGGASYPRIWLYPYEILFWGAGGGGGIDICRNLERA